MDPNEGVEVSDGGVSIWQSNDVRKSRRPLDRAQPASPGIWYGASALSGRSREADAAAARHATCGFDLEGDLVFRILRRYKHRSLWSRAAVAALLAAAAWGFLIEPYRVQAIPVTLPARGLTGECLRLLVISDVAFTGIGRRERAIVRMATAYRPDLVLVAGDLLERQSAVRDAAIVADAGAFLRALPSSDGVLLVPGEEEAEAFDRLAASWNSDGVRLRSGRAEHLVLGGSCLDVFCAGGITDPPPWRIAMESDRAFIESGGRQGQPGYRLEYRGPKESSWGPVDAAFAFQSVTPRARLDFRLAWLDGPGPEGGTGWRVMRHEGRGDFRIYGPRGRFTPLEGRVSSGFEPPVGVWCRARVRLSPGGRGTRASAKFWIEGEPEPEAWSIDVYDRVGPPAYRGTVAFGGRKGTTRYSDLVVRDTEGHELLREGFDDPRRVRRLWDSGAALEAWWETVAGGPCARIVLGHNPDIVRDIVDLGPPFPDAVICGHTHGGQVRLPGFGPLYGTLAIGRRFDRGLFDFHGVPLYITAGIGTSLVPVRMFNPPEVTLLMLCPPGS